MQSYGASRQNGPSAWGSSGPFYIQGIAWAAVTDSWFYLGPAIARKENLPFAHVDVDELADLAENMGFNVMRLSARSSQMEEFAARARPELLHVACHLITGKSVEDSYVCLGPGETWSLQQMKSAVPQRCKLVFLSVRVQRIAPIFRQRVLRLVGFTWGKPRSWLRSLEHVEVE